MKLEHLANRELIGVETVAALPQGPDPASDLFSNWGQTLVIVLF